MLERLTHRAKWSTPALLALVSFASPAIGAPAPDAERYAPVLFAKSASPQQVDFDWYLPDRGIGPPVVLRRTERGAEVEVGELQVDADGHGTYTANAARQGETMIHRVRWTAADGVAHYSASDTTVLEAPVVQALDSQFGATRVVTHWDVKPVDSRFLVALERSEDGGEFEPVTLYRTSRGESFTYVDATVQPSHTYRYRLCWGLGASSELAGLTAQAPLHGLARGRPDRLTVSWLTSAMPAAAIGKAPRGFFGTVQRRVPGGRWRTLGFVGSQPFASFVGVDSLGFDDQTAVPGQLYEYRLAWADAGDTLHSEPIAGTLPPIAASLLAVETQPPFAAKVRWQVTPDDPFFPMRVLRREEASSVWDTLGTSYSELPGLRAFDDHSREPGLTYFYRLLWQQAGVVSLTSAPPAVKLGQAIEMGRVSPNPARAGCSLTFGLPDATPTRLSFYDVGGRVQLSETFVGPGAFTYTLPRGRLGAGVYFLRLDDGHRSVSQRVVLAE